MNNTVTQPKVQFLAECPECQHQIRMQREPQMLQLINCIACDEILIITSIAPPQLDWALDFDPHTLNDSQE